MNPRYPAVAARAGHRCEYCRAPEVIHNIRFEIDHILPPGRGGTGDLNNLALSCRSCNLWKSNTVESVESDTNQWVRIFHPRTDRWNEHFSVDADSGQITGITEIGRVTVEQLKMNDPVQLTARLLWIEFQLFKA